MTFKIVFFKIIFRFHYLDFLNKCLTAIKSLITLRTDLFNFNFRKRIYPISPINSIDFGTNIFLHRAPHHGGGLWSYWLAWLLTLLGIRYTVDHITTTKRWGRLVISITLTKNINIV